MTQNPKALDENNGSKLYRIAELIAVHCSYNLINSLVGFDTLR